MSISADIEQKLRGALQPQQLQVINESHMHAGPRTESHFKLVLVATAFSGLAKVKRHQLVYRLLADELACGVHALALHLYAPEEWESAQVQESPLCSGKNK